MRRANLQVALLTLCLGGICLTPIARAEAPDPATVNELGISRALGHDAERAEACFLSVLSNRRGDARANNNLGNLSLLKGDLMVALSFYDRALAADATDVGVRLNRATVHLLLGEEDRAVEEAASVVSMAGGLERAGETLGLREATADSTRAAEKRFLTRAELRALLSKAAKSVPRGSVLAKPEPDRERGQGRRTTNWRAGATRASDDGDAASLLYWKR